MIGGRELHPLNQCRIVGFCLGLVRRDGMTFRKRKYFQHKLPFPPYKRTTAGTARYLSIVRLRPSLLIERTAVRACEWIECRWPATRHNTPPILSSCLLFAKSMLAHGVAQLSLECHSRQSCCVWSETFLSFLTLGLKAPQQGGLFHWAAPAVVRERQKRVGGVGEV